MFTTQPLTEADSGVEYTYNLSADKKSGGDIRFAVKVKPDWLTLTDHDDGTATLNGTPPADASGENLVVITATNGIEVEQSFTINTIERDDYLHTIGLNMIADTQFFNQKT